MNKIEFKNLPSLETALRAENLNLLQQYIENAIKYSYAYKEIETEEFLDETTNTHYWITKVPYRDEEENIIPIKHGFANDVISDQCLANETPRSFAKRKNATLCVNASIFGISSSETNYNHIIGPIIHEGELISNYGTDGYVNVQQMHILAWDESRNFKVYDRNTNYQDILSEGYTETIFAFDQLIINGEMNFQTAQRDLNYTWNILAQNTQTKDLFFCCCNGKNINGEQGMTLEQLLTILINNYNCDFAFRLDQGGSTALIRNDIMLNQPTDDDGTTERTVPDFLYFSKEKETDTDEVISKLSKIISDIDIDLKEKTADTGWKELTSNYGTLKYKKINNLCYLKGDVTGISENDTNIAKLPYKPKESTSFIISGTGLEYNKCWISTVNGNIYLMRGTGSAQSNYHFDNLIVLN